MLTHAVPHRHPVVPRALSDNRCDQVRSTRRPGPRHSAVTTAAAPLSPNSARYIAATTPGSAGPYEVVRDSATTTRTRRSGCAATRCTEAGHGAAAGVDGDHGVDLVGVQAREWSASAAACTPRWLTTVTLTAFRTSAPAGSARVRLVYRCSTPRFRTMCGTAPLPRTARAGPPLGGSHGQLYRHLGRQSGHTARRQSPAVTRPTSAGRPGFLRKRGARVSASFPCARRGRGGTCSLGAVGGSLGGGRAEARPPPGRRLTRRRTRRTGPRTAGCGNCAAPSTPGTSPADAGSTPGRGRGMGPGAGHPRTRGEHPRRRHPGHREGGPTPRARGAHRRRTRLNSGRGTNPARAGSTAST